MAAWVFHKGPHITTNKHCQVALVKSMDIEESAMFLREQCARGMGFPFVFLPVQLYVVDNAFSTSS